ELYMAILLDRAQGRLVLMASTQGGMEIEKVAHETPELIFKETVDPALGLMPYQARNIAFELGLSKPDELKNATAFMMALYKAYTELDCAMVEINPLVVTKQGEVMALDGKVSFDDNALYRHPAIAALDDPSQH